MRFILPIVVVAVLVGGGVAIVYGLTDRGVPVTQPIEFNHTIHLEQDIECAQCHTDAATAVMAGLPGKSICLDCHDIDDEEGEHAEKDKLFAFDAMDGDIPWQRVALTAPDVYFSHRRHVTSAQMDCLDCHEDQPTLTAPPKRTSLVMTMDDCIDCHEDRGASTDCLACHR